ncbi:MAG: alpha/beta fold hydrolase [Egibacteraceae bacterium]
MEIFDLGDFRLSTGFTLPGAKLAYKTHGRLSEQNDNAILFPHFIGGSPDALDGWVSDDRALDPRKYFIIMPGQFGNGSSSSPSNTAPPFDGGSFPPVRFPDDVIAQARLVTEHFGIQELQLVLGTSTGAMQTYEWALRFPHMVKRIAPIAGTPKPVPWTMLWLRTVIEEPLMSDPAWNNGAYTDARAVQGGLRRVGHGTALTSPPLGFYREELWRSFGFASLDDFLARFWEAFWLSVDPNDILSQSWKARSSEPSADGDLAAALRRITAKTSVIAFTGDPLFPPEECRLNADQIPHARYHEINTALGHMATLVPSDQDRKAIDNALRELLAD